MPIADASTIHFASPVFVAVFGYFLLKEKLTVIQMVTGIITLIGVVIIAKPEFIFGSESEIVHEHRIEGTILAVTACISGALVQISLRKLVKTPVSIVCVWFSLSIVISGLIILIIIDELVWPKGLDTFLLLFSIGVCSVGDQFFFTLAFKHENAGPVSVVRTFNIALVFIWEILIFSTVVEWTSAVGASIVFSCIIIITVFKWKNENSSQLQNMSIFNKIFCRKNTSNYNIEKTSIETFSQNIQ
jgi:drug/metabolite transporter (DMT)-like permease